MTKTQIIGQGAEAILIKEGNSLVKDRIRKSYRNKILDKNLRLKRTRNEARIIEKASKFIPVPKFMKQQNQLLRCLLLKERSFQNILTLQAKKNKKRFAETLAKILQDYMKITSSMVI